MQKNKIIITAGLFISAVILIISCGKTKHYELSRFISADTCGGCHDKIYEQWKGSMHNLSHTDKIYNAIARDGVKGLTDKDEITEAEICVKCHTPVGFVTGYPKKVSDDESKVPEIAKNGIQCDFCHSATGAYKVFNAKLKLDPGYGDANPGIKRGPRKDSQSDFHKIEFSEFHTKSEICGVCHDVRHEVYGTKLETTYEEWKSGPYGSDPAKQITCQDCHMRQLPGKPSTASTERPDNPGASSSGGRELPHVYTHYFVGGNTAVPTDANQLKMAEERLKNCTELKIDDSSLKSGVLKIEVKNTGAGHSIPTGFSHMREVWLEVKITSADGKTIFESGIPAKDGVLPAGTIQYNTSFGDGKGKAVGNLAKARELLSDYRLKPLETRTEKFSVKELKGGSYTVTAKLNYRTGSPALLKKIMGADAPVLRTITMTSADKKVRL